MSLFHNYCETEFEHMFEHVMMRMLIITDQLFSCYILSQFLDSAWEGLKSCSIHLNCYLSMQLIYLPNMTKLSVQYSKLNIRTNVISAMELELFHRLLIPGLLRQHPHFKTAGISADHFWRLLSCIYKQAYICFWHSYLLMKLFLQTSHFLLRSTCSSAWLVTTEDWNKRFTNALYLFWQGQTAAAEQDHHYVSQSCFWIIWQHEQSYMSTFHTAHLFSNILSCNTILQTVLFFLRIFFFFFQE